MTETESGWKLNNLRLILEKGVCARIPGTHRLRVMCVHELKVPDHDRLPRRVPAEPVSQLEANVQANSGDP